MATSPTLYSGHLIIHTGDPKTGSTSVQEAFARGDVALAEGRVAYPLDKGQFNHNGVFRRKRMGGLIPIASIPLEKPFQRFAKRTLQQNADVTVLSAERLQSVRPDALARALALYLPTEAGRLSVVTYLRPHTPRIMSGLSERIKTGGAVLDPWALLEYRSRTGMHYAPRLAAWRDAFGAAHIARPAIRSELAGGDALEDLMETALGPGQVRITRRQPSNVSLGVEDLMRIQVIQRANRGLSRTQRHALGWYLSLRLDTLRPAGLPSTPLRAHKRLAERMRRAYAADARAVDAARFAGRPLLADALDAAVDTALAARLPLHPSAWLSAEEIAGLRERAVAFARVVTAPGWDAAYQRERMDLIQGWPLAAPDIG
jgi:hypothetical protein